MMAIGAAALLAGCTSRPAPEPAPASARSAVPEITLPSPPPPPFEDWLDRPLAPGGWTYAAVAGGSEARFGPEDGAARLTLRCDSARRRLSLVREAGARAWEVQTTFGRHVLPPATDLAAADPILDEIAFSRGRFMVRAPGLSLLIVPAWPELARVIEDCRA